MAWRASTPLLRAACSLPFFALALATGGCVEDVRTEGDVPANRGATQPSTNGRIMTAEEACSRLVEAEADARDRLNCAKSPLPGCPERLRLAGSLVCSQVDEGSVDECVSAISEYRICSELDSRPCVVTVVRDTCVNPFEAGVTPPPPTDSGSRPDGSLDGGHPEGSVAPPPEAGPPPPPDAAPEAGAVVTEAGPD
jgi:hypothetical protein